MTYPRLCLKLVPVILAVLAAGAGSAQTLSVGTGSGPKGGTITVPVNLNSGTSGVHPAALEWTINYTAADFTAITLAATGDAAAAAGKTVSCGAVTSTTVTCIAAGITANTIQDGVVAMLTFHVSGFTAAVTSQVSISQAMGAAADGSSVGIFVSVTTLNIVQTIVQNIAGLVCGPATLTTPASAVCTVTLTAPAPLGGLTVAVSTDDGSLTVPVSVPVAAGSNSASFNAAASTVFANQTVHVTVKVNGTSGTAALTLTALPVASAISCNPGTVTGGSPSVCTVSLSVPARSGGNVVTLSGGTVNAVIPVSITVPSGATSNSFIVNTTVVGSNQKLTFSAAAGGATVHTNLSILSVTTLSSLTCTPGRLTPPGQVTCSIGLTGPAPSGGLSIAMGSSSSSVSVPTSVPISAGATSGIFVTTAGLVAVDTSVVVTATVGGNSMTANLTLLGPAALSPLSCSPASFSAPGSTTCTINLTHPAATGGVIATVISVDPTILVPTYVPLAAGTSSATFNATITQAVTSAKSVNLYVAASGVSTSTSITVLPPPQQVGLSCVPTTITTPGTTNCIVTIPHPAPPEGLPITLLVDNSNVIIPPIRIPYGGTSASFLITGTVVSQDVTATISVPGVMIQSLTLLAPPGVSSLTCNSAVIAGGGSTSCTVTMEKPVRGAGLDVPLASSNPALTVPALVHIPVGYNTVSFTASALATAATGPVVITASGGSSSKSYILTIRPHGVVTQVACTPQTLVGAGTTTCTANISPAAPQGGTTLTVSSPSTQIFAPPTIQVPAGAQSVQFTVSAPLISQDESTTVTAGLDGSAFAQLTLVALRPASVSCAPKMVSSGSPVVCQVTLNSSLTSNATLPLVSSSSMVSPPAAVVTQQGVASLNFQAVTHYVTANQVVTISASFQGITASDQITLTPAPPTITAPSHVTAIVGQGTVFTVTATDPAGLAFVLNAAGLPPGSLFNAATGVFTWTPTSDPGQLGTYQVQIKATNLALASSTATIVIDATTDHPVINQMVNSASYVPGPACTAGGVATLLGGGFTKEAALASTAFPVPTLLNGARLTVNGTDLPLFFVSPSQVNFQCPNLPTGTTFTMAFNGELGGITSQQTVMQYAAPGIFSTDGSGKGQGAIVVAGSSTVATTFSTDTLSGPVTPGDHISIYATGLGPVSCVVQSGDAAPADTPCPLTGVIQVLIGGAPATVSFAGLAPGYSGMYQVDAQIPASTVPGSAVPVRIAVQAPGGGNVTSNTVTIAVAPSAATP